MKDVYLQVNYLLTDGKPSVPDNIIYPEGTMVTSNHLRGTDPIYFVGEPSPEAQSPCNHPQKRRA